MPSHLKSSPTSGRKAESGLSPCRPYISPTAATDSCYVANDPEQALRDALTKARTELNKVVGEKDRFESSCEQLKKRVTDATNNVITLRSQLQSTTEERDSYKERYQQARENYNALNDNWAQRYKEMEARYNDLFDAYDELHASSVSSPKTSSLPDRTKDPRSPTKKDDRGRTRDKDREREKREKREQKAEKDRLSKRFEERRPPTSNRHESFIEGWGPGGRSASANPLSRTQYPNVAAGRPALQHGTQYGYSGPTVPRTNPLSPSGVYSSGSSAFDDDQEDGNYHAYPIQR